MNWNPERILVYRRNPEATAARLAVTPDLTRKQRVGIWDLNASAGSLPHVLDAMEDAQTYFSFYCVEAAFQTTLTTPGDHVAAEWKRDTGRPMSSEDAARNVSARPIFATAKPILDALPIEWLVVVVKSMIADSSDPREAWYNLFATTDDRIILISTESMREYAAQAGRPFESAVAGTALAMLVSAMAPEVEQLHGPPTGSIFDFCENRSDIVNVIRSPHIDAANRARIPAEILEPTEKILQVLTTYTGSTTPAQIRRQRKVFARPEQTAKMAAIAKTPATAFKMSFSSVVNALASSLPNIAARKRAVAKTSAAARKRTIPKKSRVAKKGAVAKQASAAGKRAKKKSTKGRG